MRSNGSATATTRSSSTSGATTAPRPKARTARISELLAQNGIPTTIEQHIKALNELGGLDVLGSPKTDNMYHAGWAWAGSTPYKATKLVASHFGGTRNPMAVRWPAKIKPDATPRPQFHHVNDIVPTIYEVARHHAAAGGQRRPAGPDRRRQPGLHVRRREGQGPQARPSISRSWAAAASITTAGWLGTSARAPRGCPGSPPGIREWTPDKDTVGALQPRGRLVARPTISPRRCRRSSTS